MNHDKPTNDYDSVGNQPDGSRVQAARSISQDQGIPGDLSSLSDAELLRIALQVLVKQLGSCRGRNASGETTFFSRTFSQELSAFQAFFLEMGRYEMCQRLSNVSF